MNKKYLIPFIFGFVVTAGWNLFLIHTDAKLFETYAKEYNQQIDNLKYPSR